MEIRHNLTHVQSSDDIKLFLDDYPAMIPTNLIQLDKARYETIPPIVAERAAGGLAYLTKVELVTLVEWKLKHGTFRPSLKKQVETNDENAVRDATVNAFVAFDSATDADVKAALNHLTKLRGIGPASASLLLSVRFPHIVPFFSDELFRWTFWEAKKRAGWDREIKYSLKEYLEMYSKIREKMAHVEDLSAVELEKAAYVLSRKSPDSLDDRSEGRNPEQREILGSIHNTAKTSKKRKAPSTNEDAATASARKSTKSGIDSNGAAGRSATFQKGPRFSRRLRDKTC